MSVIFGVRRTQGERISEQELRHLAAATKPYAPDGLSINASGRIGMGFQPFHTHHRSRIESQPVVDDRSNMLAFDGRLDNHRELCELLDIHGYNIPDSLIALTAFKRWGEECFSRLTGDWALALWMSGDYALYLARDHAGTRTLFYEFAGDRLSWSTYLETLHSTRTLTTLDEGYAAAFLGMLPIRDLTPYPGVRAVLPGHYVIIRNKILTTKSHWQWFPKDSIRHASDGEYEEHFRHLFRNAVARRADSSDPVVGELSGGMDSSSIVCMSDDIRRSKGASGVLVDTVSYYNDSEPHWNEKPYFNAIEEHRGKHGIHINTAQFERSFEIPDAMYLLPGPDGSSLDRENRFAQLIDSGKYRAILSGVGGDEVLGGVPIPFPELADYLVLGRLGQLLRRSTEWSIANRSTLAGTLIATMRFSVQTYFPPPYCAGKVPPWITSRMKSIEREQSETDAVQCKEMGLLPSAVCNGHTWWTIMESLPHLSPALATRYEYRYPYLDRDLVEFLFRIPREQLIRPRSRRSLMRRALRGIVPPLILERRRKAFPTRTVLDSIEKQRQHFTALISESVLAQFGLINPQELILRINSTQISDPRWWSAITRTMLFEIWLRARVSAASVRVEASNYEEPRSLKIDAHKIRACLGAG
jgi:asparagine synthase (glutamine-hydrolysing)